MCMSAVVNGSEVQYVLQSTGSKTVGWMAIGFGQTMANSPMVIMWSNSDGSVTLSQRQASAEVMPTVVASPPRVATLSQSLTTASGSQPKFGFTIASNGLTKQNIIWAFGTTNPGSSAVNAPLTQHDPSGSGTLSLDLSKTTTTTGSADPASASSSPTTTGSGSSSGGTTTGSNLSTYLPYQKLIIAHASVSSIAFLVFLPFGALLARYLRTFSPSWFRGHWIVQFGLGGPLAITGVALGIASVSSQGVKHLDDDHKKWGIGLLILYLVQCSLGGVIHFFKPSPSSRFSGRRPPQNYTHAVLGLAIIVLGFVQVRSGYHTEWPKMTGRSVPNAVGIVWYIWLVVLPLAYGAGLFLLPRQFAQEKTSHLAGQARPLSPYADNVALNSTDMRMRTA
ncbi:CBD9-like protein [Rickenella mellea]|uniref:CBD9-like protein n=1 Tax=Rickenella mellea TaxID=50990 RepID=A0A4Y7Q399_9AGAM|nr:CBD9-like protein [Rickenella mellea]